MPGVDLNLDLPSLSDTMAVIVAKLVTALSTVEDDLAAKVTPSEINANTAFSLNGNALTNAGSVQMLAGNAPSAAGSLYYANGEFYAIDAVGTIQLTAAGSLNAGALGSIVGDYGGSNPARVTYTDSTGEYAFTEDPGVYADIVLDDLVLKGANGSVRIGVDAAINTTRQIQIKSLPTSGVSMLVYNASTSTLEDGAVTAVTAMAVANLTITNPVKHGNFTRQFSLLPAIQSGTASIDPAASNPWAPTLLGSVGQTVNWKLPLAFEQGTRVRTVKVVGTGSATITVSYGNPVLFPQGSTTGAIGAAITTGSSTGDVLMVSATFTKGTDSPFYVEITYDVP